MGLVTEACLADAGDRVIPVDADAGKIERLNRGDVPIHEPVLDAVIKRNAQAGRLEFTTDAVRGVEHGFFQRIAVGTPLDEDGSADLRYVLAPAGTIETHLHRYRRGNSGPGVHGAADHARRQLFEAQPEIKAEELMRYGRTLARSPAGTTLTISAMWRRRVLRWDL